MQPSVFHRVQNMFSLSKDSESISKRDARATQREVSKRKKEEEEAAAAAAEQGPEEKKAKNDDNTGRLSPAIIDDMRAREAYRWIKRMMDDDLFANSIDLTESFMKKCGDDLTQKEMLLETLLAYRKNNFEALRNLFKINSYPKVYKNMLLDIYQKCYVAHETKSGRVMTNRRSSNAPKIFIRCVEEPKAYANEALNDEYLMLKVDRNRKTDFADLNKRTFKSKEEVEEFLKEEEMDDLEFKNKLLQGAQRIEDSVKNEQGGEQNYEDTAENEPNDPVLAVENVQPVIVQNDMENEMAEQLEAVDDHPLSRKNEQEILDWVNKIPSRHLNTVLYLMAVRPNGRQMRDILNQEYQPDKLFVLEQWQLLKDAADAMVNNRD